MSTVGFTTRKNKSKTNFKLYYMMVGCTRTSPAQINVDFVKKGDVIYCHKHRQTTSVQQGQQGRELLF